MKDVKAMIPIITLVLLICVLAGTFAWFSSFQQVDMAGLLSVENPQEVVLMSSTLTPGSLVEYNGQKGYDSSGKEIGSTDAPYIFDFDVEYCVVGDGDVDVSFGYNYICVKLGNGKEMLFEDAVRIVFGDSSFVDNADNRKAYLGVKGSYKYDSNEVGGADYFDNTGNQLVTGTTIYTYGPQYEANNADKKGFLITKNADGTGDVTEVIIKSEYVAEYFHLQYAMWNTEQVGGTGVNYEHTFPANPDWKRFEVSNRFRYENGDVSENKLQCKPHKTKIKVGLYHDYAQNKPNGNETQYGPFVFSNDLFRGCTFVFSFKISSEKVST